MATDEEIKGLPDVDLSPILGEIEKTVTETQAGEPKAVRDEKGRFAEKGKSEKPADQFKTEEDRIKGYKELQGFATRVSMENKALKEQMAALQEQQELARLAASAQPIINRRSEDMSPEEDLEQRIHRTYATQRIAEVLEEESDKNHAEFQERYAYAQMIARDPQYAGLTRTPKGVRKLFENGDKLRAEYLKKNAGKALESIFGEPLGEKEITRLKTLVKGEAFAESKHIHSDAYMPDTSTSTKSGSELDRKPNYESRMKESVEKGDVDGTLDALFASKLAE